MSAPEEHIKLLATALNNLAVGLVTVGVFGPVTTLLYDFQKATAETTILWSLPVLCACGALVLHCCAQIVLMSLGKIDEI